MAKHRMKVPMDVSSVDRLTEMQKVISKEGFNGYFNTAAAKAVT